MSDEGYHVRENTGNRDHPSVDDVIELALQRAAAPRPETHPDRHLDQYVRDAVDEHGERAVAECIRYALADGYSHRSAGAAAFGRKWSTLSVPQLILARKSDSTHGETSSSIVVS